MIRKPVTIQNNMDMEDRPVAHLVQEASQYASTVYIQVGEVVWQHFLEHRSNTGE